MAKCLIKLHCFLLKFWTEMDLIYTFGSDAMMWNKHKSYYFAKISLMR